MSKYSDYIVSVKRDFCELKQHYPYSHLTFPMTGEPAEAILIVIAANIDIIQKLCGTKEDFLGEYSKELYIQIPFDYKSRGCDVYGGKWIDISKIPNQDCHVYSDRNEYGFKFCVGVPESFSRCSNVILENVITADMMLIAYMEYMNGENNRLSLLSYSHGDQGRVEYIKTQYKENKR